MEGIKLHVPLLNAVIQCLDDIFNGNYYADRVIERKLKSNPSWGARDRGFIAETTYDIVRYFRLLNEILPQKPALNEKGFEQLVVAYFMHFKQRKPFYRDSISLDENILQERYNAVKNNPAIRESVPDWLYAMGNAELGNDFDAELSAMNLPAPVVIRTNTLRLTRNELMQQLALEGIKAAPEQHAATALVLDERKNIFRTDAFKKGLFEVQDSGSQCIGEFTGVKPGMRVIDACAGAGGKTLHLAAMMQNKGRIISMDVEEKKLLELKKRSARAGANNIETRLIDSTKAIKRLSQSCDLLLLDVPCSGTGVIRRNPDAKWKLSEEFIEKIKIIQADILQRYVEMLKPGGTLIYATCSLLKSENQDQVNRFIENNRQYTLEEDKILTPANNGTDGFYMAKLKKS